MTDISGDEGVGDKLVPDYQSKCGTCDQSPTVTIENKSGKVIYRYDMCGPCTFGTAEALDPDTW